MAVRILRCDCQSEFQDRVYGKGMRVCNECGKDGKDARCSVCGRKITLK